MRSYATVLRLLVLLLAVSAISKAQSLINLLPSSALEGDPGFTLTVALFGAPSSGGQICWTPNGGATQRVNATTVNLAQSQGLVGAIPANFIASSAGSPVNVGAAVSSTAPCTNGLTFIIIPRPTITSLSPNNVPAGNAAFTLTLTGRGFTTSTFDLSFGGTLIPLLRSNVTDTQIQVNIPANLVATARNVQVQLIEQIILTDAFARRTRAAAGPVREADSNAVPFSIRMQLNSVTPSSAVAGTSTNVNITVQAVGGFESGQSLRFGSTPLTTTVVSATQATAVIPAALLATPGSTSITYVAASGVQSNAITFSATAAPTITSLNPQFRDQNSAAANVVITGTGFASGATGTFNGNTRALTVQSATQATIALTTADFLNVGTFPIVVNVGGSNSNAAGFAVLTPLTITSLSPSSVTAGSGLFTLTVNGTGFENGNTVRFGATALSTTFVNAGQLTAQVPANLIASAGSASITVADSRGRVSPGATFLVNAPQAPTLTSLSPNPVTAGSGAFTLTVNGTGFNAAGNPQVQIGGQARATAFVSATQLTASILAADIASSGGPQVTVLQSGQLSNALTLTVLAPLTITNLNPNTAIAGGPAFSMAVTGTGFDLEASFIWDESSVPAQILSPTSAIVQVSQALIASPGTFLVSVRDGFGRTSNTVSFVVTPPGAISSISPTFRDAGSGAFTLTVNGSNFVSGSSTVLWNGASRQTTFVNAGQLTAQITAQDVLNAGTAQVSVQTGQVTTGTLPFQILTPLTITSLNPTSALAGGIAFSLTVTGTGFDSGSVVRWNGSALTTQVTNATSATASVPQQNIASAGSFPITVQDTFGRISNAINFVVNSPGAISSLSPTFRDAGSGAFTLTVNGSNFVSGSSTVLWNGASRQTTFVNAGQLTAQITAQDVLNAGTAQVSVQTGQATTGTLPFQILTPLTITSLNPTSALAGGIAFSLTVTGTGFDSGSVVRWNGSALTTQVTNATSATASVPQQNIASAGSFPITVQDTFGRISNAINFVVNSPGAISSLSPTFRDAGSGAFTLTVNGANFVSGTSTVLWNGTARQTTFVNAGQLTAQITAQDVLNAGTAQVSVQTGQATTGTLPFQILTPLTITSLNPTSALAGGIAFSLTVTGTGFDSESVVRWNGSSLSTQVTNATSATASVPQQNIASAGSFPITVQDTFGRISNAINFVVNSPGAISSLSPTFRDAGSGAFTLTVNGANFVSGSSTVLWNGTSRQTTFVNAGQLTAQITAQDVLNAGTAQVSVQTGQATTGTLPFQILTPLTITTLTPSSTLAGGATFSLTVAGTGFNSEAVIRWDGSPLATQVTNATSATATVPQQNIVTPGSHSITVQDPFGRISNSLSFVVVQPGSISSLSPQFRDAGSGAFTLTLTGADFVSGATVLWNGTARSTVFVSATQLTAQINAQDVAAAGTAQVSVQNGQTTTAALPFEILTPLTITSISPTSAYVGRPALPLTVNGTGFESGSTIRFNGLAIPTTFVNSTQLTGTVPPDAMTNVGRFPVTVLGRFGRTSNSLEFALDAGISLTSIDPVFRVAGSGAFTLTVNGTNFNSLGTVLWNGQPRPTTFVSATVLTAAIPATDVANPGLADIAVRQLDSVTTAVVRLEIVPSITISSLSPSSANAGDPAFTLTVTGTNFETSAVVEWNGAVLPTTFVSPTQLTAAVPAANIASAGVAQVRVRGRFDRTSNFLQFTINGALSLTSINPTTVEAGGQAFTLTATGQNFGSGCVILFNGNPLPTTCNNTAAGSSATATVSAASIAQPGTASISVRDSLQRTSSSLTLTIGQALTLSTISPTELGAGSVDFELTATGTGFPTGTRLRVGATDLNTTQTGTTQLRATVPRAVVAAAGAVPVVAFTPDNRVSNALNITVRPAPVITGISPSSLNVNAGAVDISVTGQNFLASSVVAFDGSAQQTTFVSATQLTVRPTPAFLERAGTIQVSVVNPIGSRSNNVTLSVGSGTALTLSLVTPTTVDAGGPEFDLVATGSGFVSGASIQFGNLTVPTTFADTTRVTGRIPASAIADARSLEVSVVNPNGDRSNSVTFVIRAAPRITSVNPTAISADGPAVTFSVSGSGFVSGSVVRFNGSALTTRFVSSNSLQADLVTGVTRQPPSASISVANPDGAVSNSVSVEIVTLTLTSINPGSARVGTTTPVAVTLTGTGFLSGAQVLLDGVAGTGTVESRTSIRAEIPASLLTRAREISVTVRNPDGGLTGAVIFRVADAISLDGINPSEFRVGSPDVEITATGTGFTNGSTVELNGSALSTQFLNATSLRATVPASALAQPGRLVFRVSAGGGIVSNELALQVTATQLLLSSVNPAAVNIDGPGFTLRAGGSGFTRSSVLRFGGSGLATSFISETALEAAVPPEMIAAAAFPGITGNGVDVQITVQDGGSTSNAVSLRVAPVLTLTTVNPSTLVAGAGDTTITVDGTGFSNGGTQVFFGDAAISSVFVSGTRMTAVIPASLLTSARTAPVTVRNASGVTTAGINFVVTEPVPSLSVQVPAQITGGSAQVGVNLASPSPADLSGIIELTFVAADTSLPQGYSDPALAFVAGGRTVSFTIARGSSVAVLAGNGGLNVGTVAGTITLRIIQLVAGSQNVLPSPAPTATLAISRAAPSITPGSVRIIDTATGFDVEVIGSSNTREISRATLAFTAAPGAVTGDTTFTVDVTAIFTAYFNSQTGRDNGGAFRLRIPFTVAGGAASVIQSVTVTLTNAVGASNSVSGGR